LGLIQARITSICCASAWQRAISRG